MFTKFNSDGLSLTTYIGSQRAYKFINNLTINMNTYAEWAKSKQT